MSEALLIEEAGDRMTDRLRKLLTLVLLSFDEGEARARALASRDPTRIIDPVASACFAEARQLLLRPASTDAELRAGLFAALFALDAAASSEPACYRRTHEAVRALALDALDAVVADELASARSSDADELARERPRN